MTTHENRNPPNDSLIMSAEEWLNAEFSAEESEMLIGTPGNALVRPRTKNLIQAPEKAYKTTFLLRLTLGLSSGETAFPSLPVCRPQRVLYLHGELNPAELKERLRDAARGLSRPLDQFFQGRSLTANIVTEEGQRVIRELVEKYQPNVLVIDPWQSSIAGADENSFKEMSGATKYLDTLIEGYGLTLFIAVHMGKDHSRGARGHSLVAGWRDTKFTLTRDKNGLTVTVDPRWGASLNPLKLNFRDGTLLEGDAPRWTKQAEEIRALLSANQGRLSRGAIGLGLGLEGSTLRTALMRAEGKRAIRVDGEWVSLSSPASLPPSPNHPLLEGGGICDGDAGNQ
jgi:hypothetical protein